MLLVTASNRRGNSLPIFHNVLGKGEYFSLNLNSDKLMETAFLGGKIRLEPGMWAGKEVLVLSSFPCAYPPLSPVSLFSPPESNG